MKSRLLSLATVVVLLLVASGSSFAQGSIAPSSQLGIGVNTDGLSIQYAISPSIHVGMMATLASQSSDGNSATYFGVAPYLRMLLEGTVNPMFEVGVAFEKAANASIFDSTNTTTSIFATFGLEYFINRNVGVFAAAQLLNLRLDPSPTVTTFGYFAPRAGVEWFFDR